MSAKRRDSLAPLIGSIEGIAQTPAYRGLALAVFENLELAEYGNRIPFLTFEVEADPASPPIGAVLGDASQGQIQCDSSTPVNGYAAHGSTMKSALEPLVEHFGIDLFDDGTALRSPAQQPVLTASESDLGCSAGADRPSRMERTQVAARSLPATLTLSYYDAARDYQTSQMRGSIGEVAGEGQERAELPMVLDAAAAKGLVQSALARRWSRRDRLMLRLPPRFMVARPGSTIGVGSIPSLWTVEQATVEGMSVAVRLRAAVQPVESIAADSGRPIPNSDSLAGETRLTLFDIPDLEENQPAGPTLYIAASSSSGSWNSRPVEIHSGDGFHTIRTAPRKTVLGTALNQLAPAQAYLFDLTNRLEVELADHGQWLENRDEEALVHGANLSVLGDELIQFGTVEPIGPGRFRLSKLLRGRRGTEWAMTLHSAGEAFALLEPNCVSRAELPPPMRGATIRARARGLADGNADFVSRQVSGESLRPPSPVHLKAARSAAGDLQVNWVRRSRTGWAWLDEVDCPLGETREAYRVTLEGAGSTLEVETELTEATFGAAAIESMAPGTAILSVQQIGDHAASRPATIEIPLN